MQRYKFTPLKHTLEFCFKAETSRGVLPSKKQVFFIQILDKETNQTGIGECSPFFGLSLDESPHFFSSLERLCLELENQDWIEPTECISVHTLPSIFFALETAWKDLQSGGNKCIYDNSFYRHETGIKINGLIWMGSEAFRRAQIDTKISEGGYKVIKLKIAQSSFETDIRLLEYIQTLDKNIRVRLDANGAFETKKALSYLERLQLFNIDYIEQPIAVRMWEDMCLLSQQSPIPIAIDEELIGCTDDDDKLSMLDVTQAHILIIKPTLVGGLSQTQKWIDIAKQRQIPYCVTSALESNIGLNAICQLVAENKPDIEQGLGTGQLYYNNISSPLYLQNQHIFYDNNKTWSKL